MLVKVDMKSLNISNCLRYSCLVKQTFTKKLGHKEQQVLLALNIA